MALRWPLLLRFRSQQPLLAPTNFAAFSDLAEPRAFDVPCLPSVNLLHRSNVLAPALKLKVLAPYVVKCLARSTEEKQWSDAETVVSDSDEAASEDDGNGQLRSRTSASETDRLESPRVATPSSGDSLSLGIREPVYEVVEVRSDGTVSTRKINRRQLLKSSGLRPRDIRSVDPSLFLTNSVPSLLVREYAILLNLGSLRAIAMKDCVLIFDYNRKGGQAFLESLLPRLNPKNSNGGPSMPFELEVQALLEALPNRLTGDILEQLRISKQTLVELGSRAGALRQMLLDLLEDPHEIRRICIMGRNCTVTKGDNLVECSVPLEKQIAEEEEEEIEMLLENYLQRCESCHGQAERLLDSAREMEDSIAVSLSSRRLEVSRVELLLQVGTFCVAVGALVAGIFGMNLKSYLEEHVFAFWLTTAGIIVGAVVAFFLMYFYLKARKIF
ncbi:magnesium transporter MRS2-11, chloroplastic isoform X2 [Arachis ipaensis]|uniref:magnesium transporter MRS2-11, chloroplastic isoform X2 n=1 Tax=Arachis ipaensis TaxID=130454 RepID=UPI000A2B136C|nr:magnesium transporter MRS2-11, chloroplastic isoform X2 [Arachis ipaensis]XP_025671742.1 magnesium transporter MRS2-11, chloroplastic isoform X2 [Arachis hypogaea]